VIIIIKILRSTLRRKLMVVNLVFVYLKMVKIFYVLVKKVMKLVPQKQKKIITKIEIKVEWTYHSEVVQSLRQVTIKYYPFREKYDG
jgi:hypothetical protein